MPWLAYKPFGDIHSICPWANTPILVFNKVTQIHDNCYNDGIVDSLRSMIFSENFIKPWCNEHILVKLLTKAF